MNLCDIRTVKQIMEESGLRFRKEFGQNFLIDRSVVEEIAESCCDNFDGTVLEIGPGIGTLTQELASRHKKIVALEIDRTLIPVLKNTLSEFDNVTVHNIDVMKADLNDLLKEDFQKGRVSVCANLPYYITSPILMKLLESRLPFDFITVMVQKEVADRLCAKAGTKDYGSISASVAYYGRAEKILQVPAHKFMPAPKVDSTVVRIKLWNESNPIHVKSEDLLFRTIRAAFGQRRKTLANALDSGFSELDKSTVAEIIHACGFDEKIRGERLSIEDFAILSEKIGEKL